MRAGQLRWDCWGQLGQLSSALSGQLGSFRSTPVSSCPVRSAQDSSAPHQCFFPPWHLKVPVTLGLSRAFFDVTGTFLRIVTGTSRACHGHFFGKFSRALKKNHRSGGIFDLKIWNVTGTFPEICHGHFSMSRAVFQKLSRAREKNVTGKKKHWFLCIGFSLPFSLKSKFKTSFLTT